VYASAALFARLHVGVWDGSISGWYSKYKYLHWRPETALRYGDNSTIVYNTTSKAGNWPSELTTAYSTPSVNGSAFTPLFNFSGVAPASATVSIVGPATDPAGSPSQLHAAWWPELSTPGHPEYPSTHSQACESAVTALRLFFGTDNVSVIANGSSLSLASEDTYYGNGMWAGNGGRNNWQLGAANASVVHTYLNLTGNVSLNGTVAGAAPYVYNMTNQLPNIKYATLSQMSRDCSDSRVWGGIHLNISTTDGIALGHNVGAFVYAAYPGNLTSAVSASLKLFGAAAA
jgi:hypothetical protein